MQEDEADEHDAKHHGEGAHVVRVGRGDIPLVLGVFQWPHRHLQQHAVYVIVIKDRKEGKTCFI